MRYLITANLKESDLPRGIAPVARGEAMSLEESWPFGKVLISRVADGAERGVAELKNIPNIVAVSAEAMAEPSNDPVFTIGVHIMNDAEGMKPYIAAVAPVIAPYDCTYLARTSTVSVDAGSFRPNRFALMQFPAAERVAAWYTSEAYAPLLKIRLRCAESREVLVMADGKIPDDVRETFTRKVASARVI